MTVTDIQVGYLISPYFKLVTMPEKETALMAIPKICVGKKLLHIIQVFALHQGV